jgi:hypothetical protein
MELTAKYRIKGLEEFFEMLIAMTGAGQTQRGLDRAPTQTLNFLACRLKAANVSRQRSPIQLIPHIEDVHGRN